MTQVAEGGYKAVTYDNKDRDIIDDDLYEDLDEEELRELIEAERQKALAKEREKHTKKRRRFPKWIFWLIAAVMILNIGALIPKTFSIPVIDFLTTSAQLSTQEDIQTYKESVVVIETNDGRGTGFSIASDGTIITNYHVIEDQHESITVAYPKEGLFSGDVVETYPSVDLAVVNVDSDEESLPSLDLADKLSLTSDNNHVYFIGNPLWFNGIVNEGELTEYVDLKDWDKPVVMLDAPVFRGNSGSPVINESGEVTGIVFATLNHDDFGNVGLVIPIDYFYDYSGS